MHLDADADAALKSCLHAIAVDPLCETAHVHLAHLHLQRNDLEAAIAACAARLDAPRSVGAMDIQKKCKPCACARCGLCAAEGGG